MLFLFKSTPENKERKHSEHFLHHQEPMGSQRADRTYCTFPLIITLQNGLTVDDVCLPMRLNNSYHSRTQICDHFKDSKYKNTPQQSRMSSHYFKLLGYANLWEIFLGRETPIMIRDTPYYNKTLLGLEQTVSRIDCVIFLFHHSDDRAVGQQLIIIPREHARGSG